MLPPEPAATAVLMATFGTLMAVSVLCSRATERLGVPIVLLFLLLGMLAGAGLDFHDHRFAFRIGTAALVLILLDGGLNTSLASIRKVAGPASVLATLGVAATTLLVALAARAAGFGWREAFLLGAVVSSTDAAAVFAVLRGSRLNLSKRIGLTLELEAGVNDPMAVILTAAITQSVVDGTPIGLGLALQVPLQLAIGSIAGVLVGRLGAAVLRRVHLRAAGLYPVLTLGIGLLAFGLTTLVGGSGFLAVYAAAVMVGNSELPYRSGLTRIHDALAWLGQISMFLMLGLLVVPADLLDVAGTGLALALFIAFVARPVATALCLAPFRYTLRETAYIGWVGLRGAIPIVLATFPVMAGAPEADRIFNVVFFVVVVNALVPGATVRWITSLLRLDVAEPPQPAAVLEINSSRVLKGEITSFYVDETLAVCGTPLSAIPFPQGAAVVLVVRGEELLAARGGTVLAPGDHAYVFCRPEDRPYVQLLFGRPES